MVVRVDGNGGRIVFRADPAVFPRHHSAHAAFATFPVGSGQRDVKLVINVDRFEREIVYVLC